MLPQLLPLAWMVFLVAPVLIQFGQLLAFHQLKQQ